jgi:hypothetical protein
MHQCVGNKEDPCQHMFTWVRSHTHIFPSLPCAGSALASLHCLLSSCTSAALLHLYSLPLLCLCSLQCGHLYAHQAVGFISSFGGSLVVLHAVVLCQRWLGL